MQVAAVVAYKHPAPLAQADQVAAGLALQLQQQRLEQPTPEAVVVAADLGLPGDNEPQAAQAAPA